MDEGTPSLEIGFVIDTGGSFSSITQLQNVMESAEGKILSEVAAIERGVGGMMQVGPAKARIEAFGIASTRELQNVAREKARTEKTGEALIRQLEREAASLGKTRDQLRDAKVETLALTAAQQGNTDLADRLAAAARRRALAAEAAAEADLKAAEAAKQLANAATLGARADRLRASIDPAAAAQQRFNREMAEARTLISAGAITLDDYAGKLRIEQAALDASANSHARLGKGATAGRMAMQGASYQVQDFITQVSMGANPINAFAVQGAQLAGQFSMVEGKAGSVARFFMGPWGLGLTAGLMLLAPFVSKLWESGDALDDAIDKLKKDARETDNTSRAKDLFSRTLEGNAVAIRENREALDRLADSGKTAARQALEGALAANERARVIRQETRDLLDNAVAMAEYNRQRATRGGPQGEAVGLSLSRDLDRINELRARLDAGAAQVEQTERQVTEALGRRVIEMTEARATALGRLKERYEGPKGLIEMAFKQASAEEIRNGTLSRQIDLLRQKQKAEEDALRASERKATSQNEIGRNIGIGDARAIVVGLGGRVTSDLRSREEQERLYAKYMAFKSGTGPWAALAAKPGTSNHELGNAIDVAKSAGVTLKKLVAAFRAKGVALTEALDEGSHYHLAWKAVGDQARQQAAEIRAAAREATDAEATAAQTANLYKLADAYEASGGEALIAAARLKAESEAIRNKGDIEASVARDVGLAIAQRVADAAQNTAGIREQAAAQAAANAAVAAGVVPAERADELVKEQLADLPLLAAIQAANNTKNFEGAIKATLALDAQREARRKLSEEERKARFAAAMAGSSDQIAVLEAELRLIGETDAARMRALVTIRATQEARRMSLDPEQAAAFVAEQVRIAELTGRIAVAQNAYNSSLSYTRDLLGEIGDRAGTVASVLSNAFGDFGSSVGDLLTNLNDLQSRQQEIADWRRDEMAKAGDNATRRAQIEVLAAKRTQTAEMQATVQAISGVKSLFKEKSTAFKVMSALEKGYAVWQAAETIASIVRDSTKTASHLANSAVRTTANTAEGGSKIFAELGPWGFPVVAAMVAVLAALGARGGRGGSSGPSIPTAEDLQSGAGTGTVLGDSKAKSDSIARSLELVAANTNSDLQYSNAMLKALRSIDTSITKMAGTVARQISVDGSMFDTSGLKLGESGKKGFLGIGGSSTTRTLWDLGMTVGAATVADIIANGISGSTYQTVQKVKKSNGFFGIGGGTKTSYSTSTGVLDGDITGAIQDVVRSLRDGLLSAASVIGLQGAEAILNSFNVSIGKLSFKDMTGEQIEAQLNAIFSSIGDQMASTLLPSLRDMQLVGEGLFETFIRVAKEYEAVDFAMQSIGRTFGAVGVQSVAARDALVQLFGGLEEFIEGTSFFRDNFLTEAQQIAPVQAAVIAELQRLGLSSITTRDQFRDTVLGLDLTTSAGRELYAALLSMAPAFDKVLDYQTQAQKQTIDGLKSTIDQFSKFAEGLRKYREGLFATDVAQGSSYARLKAQFSATAALAAAGDATALGGLEGAGKAFLDAAKAGASTREQYLRDVALVAQGVDKGIFAAEETADYAQLQLDALGNAVSILGAINTNTAATAAAIGGSAPSNADLLSAAGTSGGASNTSAAAAAEAETNARLAEQNDTLIRQGAAMVEALTKLERYWSRIEGDGMLVRTDADSPISTVSA